MNCEICCEPIKRNQKHTKGFFGRGPNAHRECDESLFDIYTWGRFADAEFYIDQSYSLLRKSRKIIGEWKRGSQGDNKNYRLDTLKLMEEAHKYCSRIIDDFKYETSKKMIQQSMIHRHITKAAITAEKRCKARITVWNESSTIELTMTIPECRRLEKDHFIDIDSIIEDELMGKLLHHFRDLGHLYDQEDLCLV
jgi:hypothetical protein